MIIMAIINGSGQVVNYAMSIIFPAKMVTWSTITFHSWKDELNMEGDGGVHGKFLHILVQEFVS